MITGTMIQKTARASDSPWIKTLKTRSRFTTAKAIPSGRAQSLEANIPTANTT